MTKDKNILSKLQKYQILDTAPEPEFDELGRLACQIFGVPIAMISFATTEEVFYKTKIGLETLSSEQRKNSIFSCMTDRDEVLVEENLQSHSYFFYQLNDIKFFASAPIVADGCYIGHFTIMDNQMKTFDENEKKTLKSLSKMVVNIMEARLVKLEQSSLLASHEVLFSQNEKLSRENLLLVGYRDQVASANSDLESVLDSYELLFKHTPTPIGIFNHKSRKIWQANDALLSLFGGNVVLVGAHIESLVGEINGVPAGEIFNLIDRTVPSYHKKGARLQIKKAGRQKNIYVDISLQFVGRMGDEADNVMFILADVSDQVTQSKINQQANIVLMEAIQDTGLGYTIVEFDTGLMTSNAQLKANYGFGSDEEINYPDIFNAMLPEYRQVIKKAVNDAIQNKEIYQAEYEVKWRDGSVHRIKAYGKPVYDAEGRATHIIGLNKIISS